VIDTDRLKAEMLTALGSAPQKLHTDQPNAVADLCIRLGNFLLWHHDKLAPGEAQIESPLGHHPDTVWGLAKQFREVGQTLWDAPQKDPGLNARLEAMQEQIDSLYRYAQAGGAK
jgi:hypothetical protein